MGAPKRTILDNDGQPLEIDEGSGAVIFIDTIHARIHAGEMYEATAINAALADAAHLDMLVNVAGKPAHMRFQANTTGQARLRLYETPVYSAQGANVVPRNRRRSAGDAATVEVHSGPTVSDVGTLLTDEIIPGGSTGGKSTVGSTFASFEEFILPVEGRYLVRLTNVSGSAIGASISLSFYEVEPV